MPLVSIITPLYRAEAFAEDLAWSLRAQTMGDFEWICVDDCSPDRSAERFLAAAGGLDLKLVRLAANGGPAAARNAGLRLASGRYVAFLDADDLWLPRKLERQVDFMDRHGYRFTFHDYRRMSFDGRSVGAPVRGPDEVDWAVHHKRRGLGCLTVMVERSMVPDDLFPSAAELGEGLVAEDFLAWSRLLRPGLTAHRLPEDLARYRLAPHSRSASRLRSARSVWNIYRVHERIPLLRCSWYFLSYVTSASLLRASTLPRVRRDPGECRPAPGPAV
jgi:glycosyltransferase involved in cell wall biosynthesis